MTQPDRPRRWHISSAIVVTRPERAEALCHALPDLEGVEVHAAEGTRIVITIEGTSTGQLGDRLTAISLMDGVIAANMVYERADEEALHP